MLLETTGCLGVDGAMGSIRTQDPACLDWVRLQGRWAPSLLNTTVGGGGWLGWVCALPALGPQDAPFCSMIDKDTAVVGLPLLSRPSCTEC